MAKQLQQNLKITCFQNAPRNVDGWKETEIDRHNGNRKGANDEECNHEVNWNFNEKYNEIK